MLLLQDRWQPAGILHFPPVTYTRHYASRLLAFRTQAIRRGGLCYCQEGETPRKREDAGEMPVLLLTRAGQPDTKCEFLEIHIIVFLKRGSNFHSLLGEPRVRDED